MHEGIIIQQTKRKYHVHDQPGIFHLRHLYPKWQDSFAALMCHEASSANMPLSSLLTPQATTRRPVLQGKGESCQTPTGSQHRDRVRRQFLPLLFTQQLFAS